MEAVAVVVVGIVGLLVASADLQVAQVVAVARVLRGCQKGCYYKLQVQVQVQVQGCSLGLAVGELVAFDVVVAYEFVVGRL